MIGEVNNCQEALLEESEGDPQSLSDALPMLSKFLLYRQLNLCSTILPIILEVKNELKVRLTFDKVKESRILNFFSSFLEVFKKHLYIILMPQVIFIVLFHFCLHPPFFKGKRSLIVHPYDR